MRFNISHPSDPALTAAYGWDRALGFFVTVRRRRRILEDYDCFTDGYEHLDGVLKVLIRHEFLDICLVIDAMLGLQHCAPEELDPELRLTGQVISNLRAAADQ